MEVKTNPIIKTIARIAAQNSGCSLKAMTTRNPIGPALPKEVKRAKGAALYLTKRYGLKLTDMCDYLSLNYGNASTVRIAFEQEASRVEINHLIKSANEQLLP